MTSETSGRKPRPLQGLQVLELADEMGVYAGKLLADAGARVIKVEPPGGSAMRHRGPYLNDDPGPDRSLYFAFYNTGKESVTLDLGDEDDREVARRLASQADVVIDGMGLGRLASAGLSYEALRGDNPGLIWLQITPFGPDGPWASYKTSDLVALALGGPLFDCGYDDHSIPPIRGGGNQGYAIVSNLAMCAVMVALLWRQQSGEGQHIDLSMHDAC
ncbi:MAG TPA: CoA transferase, partial [Dehalococcoidia bacterium]|nr:CoA transferase [Dehalococcoidia bacterium]